MNEIHSQGDTFLAPFAIKHSLSQGRRSYEPKHSFRTDFQRDRDRILHSRAFRRLECKTQVFLNGTGDHLRTRLTHTIEVAAISRTLARALNLNEDLSESVALGHDLGHPPYGHPGENVLNELMTGHGGFDHNDQALRVVDLLEIKYPQFDGLNLTWEVRTGLIKHRDRRSVLDGETLPPQPALEAQCADLADDLAYYGHDVDDGLESQLISSEMLSELEIWRRACEEARVRTATDDPQRLITYAVRCLINMMVADATRNSRSQLEEQRLQDSLAAQNSDHRLISFSPEFQRMTDDLREFLHQNLYHHRIVEDVNINAIQRMRKLFKVFIDNPELMGGKAKGRIDLDGVHRVTADYISGMTDRYALLEYQRCCE